VVGRTPPMIRITNSYLDRVMTAAETDPLVTGQFMRVIGMLDPPARLLRPSIMLRVVWANRPRRTSPQPASESVDSAMEAQSQCAVSPSPKGPR